jgi:hypothetical protein
MGDGLAAIVRSRVSALSTVRTVRMYELYSTVVQSSAANLVSCPNSGGREHNGHDLREPPVGWSHATNVIVALLGKWPTAWHCADQVLAALG